MPYTPPSQRSPAASAPNSPSLSRRGSYQPGQISGPPASSRPELPRSTSYLTRHRRTPSVKTSALVPTPETTPPSTADNEKNNDASSLTAPGTLRQSPPPVTDESQMPAGAVISPPESSDDEDRGLEKLAELQRAIRIIEQHRESSPTRTAAEVEKTAQALHLVVPDELSAKPIEQLLEFPKGVHKIAHNRSNTDSSVFVRLGGEMPSASETPLTGSDLDDSDSEESGRSGRKPPMLRKKSGELVRPALRPSSARRRPSSMPGTPTFSKAVHFDSHLEHVRHFLQVDRPLAVSAGSSPVEAYDSDTEFPFGEDDNNGRSPPFEWEIVVANFPAETHKRLAMPVRVERVFLSSDNKTLIGSIAVANLAFNKWVVARFTLDYWKTTSEVVAEYNHDVRQQKSADGYDRFNFNIRLADQANLEAKTMFFCVKYCVNGQEHWDNNNNTNFQVDFKKKYKPQNGKRGMQGNNSKPVHHSLPRSQKSSPPASAGNKPKMAAFDSAFDDFGDGFDPKYKFVNTKEAMKDFLAEPDRTVRLKGSQSAVHLGSDNLTRRVQTSGQAFGNRYDFGASLNAAIAAANRELGDRSGITMKSNIKKKQQQQQKQITDGPVTESPISAGPAGFNKAATSSNGAIQMAPSASGTDSPRTVADKAVLGSQSYNEILDKYCFFGSSKNSPKNSPQVKEGTLKSGQYDGSNDDGYVLGSTESSVDSSSNNSPLMMQSVKNQSSPPRPQQQSTQASRSASPAPMTGFVSGTSMYPYHMHHGFPFNEAHVATAIRG